ncbi:MAG TPA: flagellar hook-length control protein FliK [Anaerovoracaceae bacterium]|nr:flagellar hook-length control protein FliK [Anaerovoracaceae bacterium]
MNINNNLGMALFSKDLSGTAAIGDFQSMANGVSDNPEGSLFQQLISQMLTEKNDQKTEGFEDNLIGGEKGKSGGIGGLLSELLLAGGNLSKMRIQNEGSVIDESAENKVQSEESALKNENAEALEAIQALMAGLTNAMPVSNTEKLLTESQTGNSIVESSSAAITSIKTTASDLGMLEAQKYIPSNPEAESIPEEMTEMAGKTSVLNGTTDQTEASSILQNAGKTVQAESAFRNQLASISNESLKSANGKSEEQEGISAQGFKISETGTVKQTAAAETQTHKSITDQAEKMEAETETDRASQDRMSFQNTMQGAVKTSEVKEPSSLTQPVEASEPYNQIREEILSKLDQKGSTEFKMQLHPEDLGQIDIKLKLSEGKLVIDILAANSKTQALLTGQVDKLIASMGLQNVQVESVHVSQQMNSQTQDNSQSQGYTMSSGMDFSQRRQQEQLRQENLNGSKVTGTFNLQQDEAQTNNPMNHIESIRYNSHRMNYAV